MLTNLTLGTLLGLAAGFAPGPLLFLVLRESLHHGSPAGIRTALAPLISDPPIILLSFFLVAEIARYDLILGLISLAGAALVGHLGWDSLKTADIQVDLNQPASSSLRKGVLINVLSPHPYIFWFTVGAPIILQARDSGPLAITLFLGGFYFFLVGSKIFLAVLIGRSRNFLGSRAYLIIMRLLGVLLLLFAGRLLLDAVAFFL